MRKLKQVLLNERFMWWMIAMISVGLAFSLYGVFKDPFIIPFQDWHQMPLELQNAYLQQAENAKNMMMIGALFTTIGIVLLLIRLILRRRD